MDTEHLLRALAEIDSQREQLQSGGPCDCENHLEIRIRRFGGGEHHVYQCQSCGEQRGGSIARKAALELLNGTEAKAFDEGIEEARRIEARTLFEERMALLDEERRIRALLYGIPHWESDYRREQEQLEAANSQLGAVIEQCLNDYGQEKTLRALIKQTVAIKKLRYEELRNSISRFSCENEVKEWFFSYFAPDFHISDEVWGRHLAANVNVRIDFILTPRQHLIEAGFDPAPFGVEAKYFKQESGFTHKTSRAFWQSISYNDCEFELDNKKVRLKYCLLYSNLSFEQELALVKNYGHELENDQVEWRGMVHVANHANVGVLQVPGSKDAPKGWVVKFAGGIYFYKRENNGKAQYLKSNEDVVNKVRVGNF